MDSTNVETEFADSATLDEMEEQLLRDSSDVELEDNESSDELSASDHEVSSDYDEETSEEVEDTDQTPEYKKRFEDPDKVYQAYRNLESQYTRTAQELSAIKKQLETASSPQDKEKQLQDFAKKAKENPLEAIHDLIDSKLKPLEIQKLEEQGTQYYRQLQTLEDFADLEPTMVQITEQCGDLIQGNVKLANDPRVMELLYLAAKGLNAQNSAKEAEKRGEANGAKKQVKKMKAKVEGASSGGRQVKKSFDMMSLEEMEKELERGNL